MKSYVITAEQREAIDQMIRHAAHPQATNETVNRVRQMLAELPELPELDPGAKPGRRSKA